jgi:WD40 repeat protein
VTHTTTEAGPATRSSPFQGLTQFRSNDERYFFGRETEREILKANLIVSRLTIVYGSSGVGKSSLLGAGVQHDLLEESQSAIAAGKRPEHLIVLHAGPWHRDAVRALDDAIRAAVGDVHGAKPPAPGSLPLDELLRWWTDHLRARLLIVLDQFEEYLLYAETTAGLRLDRELPPDIDADFMISIREDALAGLDRFKTRIPNLFETRVRVDHLDREAATRAIREPIDRWNGDFRDGLPPITVEDELIETVLDQVRTGQVVVGRQGRGTDKETDRIETPHLQLVMQKLWEAENLDVAEPVLRRATLERLGGARQIVVTRGREAIDKLPPDDQRIVAAIFDRLVTPSGAKIAHALEDLAKWAKVEPTALRPILDKLCAGNLRILRPIAPAPGASGGPRYELFHDVLAGAILDWQARYENEQEQQRLARKLAAAADEQRRAEEQARREQENARRADENARAAAENARRAEENASRARRRSIVALATAGIALALLIAGAYLWHQNQQQAASARSVFLVAYSDKQLATNPERSLLLSLEAYRSEQSTDAVRSMIAALDAADSPGAARYLHGHIGAVNNMALNRDGGMLASAGDDGTVRLWDVAGGRQLGEPLLGHKGPVQDVAFSPDGRMLASAGADGAIYLWDPGSRTRLCKLGVDKGPVWGVAFSRDGRTLASADDAGLRLWDLPRPLRCVHRVRPLGRTRKVFGVSFSPDGRTLAAAGADQNENGTIELWDLRVPTKPPHVLRGHEGLVQSIAFNHVGSTLASAGVDGTIRLWDGRSGRQLDRAFAGHKRPDGQDPVYTVAFSPDGRMLASGDNSGKVRLWSVRGLAPRRPTLTGHPAPVHTVTFGRDGRTLFSAGADGTIRLWDLRSHTTRPLALHGHAGIVWSVAFSPGGGTLASAGNDGTIRLWDLRSGRQPGRPLKPLTARAVPVYSVSYRHDGEWLATGDNDGTIRIWDVHTSTPKQVGQPLHGHAGIVWSVAFSPDGDTLASAGDDGTIRIWDVHTSTPKQIGQPLRVPGNSGAVNDIAFSPDGRTLASAYGDWVVRLWDVHDPTRVTPAGQMAHDSDVYGVAFSPDGRTIASSSADTSIRLWDARTHTLVDNGILHGHRGAVHDIAFSADGRTLASAGSDDATIRLWDVPTRSQLGEPFLGDTKGTVLSVAFSPEGHSFASAGVDGTIRVRGWNADLELRERVCGLVGTGLSHTEWERLAPKASYHQSCP